MGISGGPNILGDENLSFIYDTSDSISYLGEPTTNYASGDAGFTANIDTTTTNVTTTLANGIVGTVRRLTVVGNTYGGVIRASLGHNLPFSGIPQGGQSYTISCWIRNSSSGSVAAGWEAEVGASDSYARPDVESGFVGNYASSVQPNTVSSSWSRISYTYSYTTTKTSAVIPFIYFGNPIGGSGAGIGSTIDFYDFQIELNSHPTQFLAAGTSRSISGSLLDLTPNRSQAILNTSYDSNAQIIFNGSNNYISIPNSDLVNPGTGSFTIICWVNSDPSVTGDGWDLWVAKRVDGSNGYYVGVNNPLGARFMIGNNVGGRTDTGFISYTYNTWAMFTSILDRTANTQTIIRNAYEEISTVTPAGGTYSNASNLYIGGDVGLGAFYVNGRQPIVSIYNRALSQSEVIQNYNALKSRFNL